MAGIKSLLSFNTRLLKIASEKLNLSISEKKELEDKLNILLSQKVNILIIGGTGVGKSSTINALFKQDKPNSKNSNQAKIGDSFEPETQNISNYEIGNLIFWDTPGLGESIAADSRHIKEISQKLQEKTDDGQYLIDLILIIFDGATRDYGSTINLLNIASAALKKDVSRIVVGVNRIDLIRGGRGWNEEKNEPLPWLKDDIILKLKSVTERIKKDTTLDVKPIGYSAGFVNTNGDQSNSYNIDQLLCEIIGAIKPEKRLAVIKEVKQEVITTAKPVEKQRLKKSFEETAVRTGVRAVIGTAISALFGFAFGGCYITTSVCHYYGKSDKCHLMMTLRHFRDKWLIKQKDGAALIEEYYRTAPQIVDWINKQANKDALYKQIYKDYLNPCYKMIKHRKNVECKNHYKKMVIHLQNLMKSSEG